MPCLFAVNDRVLNPARRRCGRFLVRKAIRLFALLVAVCPVVASAAVTNYVWDGNAPSGNGGTRWSVLANWHATNTVPPAADSRGLTDSDITFRGSLKTRPILDTSYFVRTLTFDPTAGAFTLTSGGPQTLTVGAGGIVNQSANRQTILSAITLGSSQIWNASAGDLAIGGNLRLAAYTLTVAGDRDTFLTNVIQGGHITKTGNGNLVLAGSSANVYTGGTTLDNGTITLAKFNALGNGSLTINGGTLNLGSSDQAIGLFSMNGGSVVGSSGLLTASSYQLNSGTVNVRLGGTGSLIKSTPGTTTVTAANLFSGGTIINGGTLAVNNTTGSGTGSGNVSINNGGTLAGNGTISGLVANGPGGTIAPGNSVGQLNTGSETWSGGSSYQVELSDATASPGVGWDLLNIAGTLSILATDTDPAFVDITTLMLNGLPGQAANFDPTQAYLWTIVQTTGGITFAPGQDVSTAFALLTGGVANPFGGGAFDVATGNGGLNLNLVYTPATVPEPQAVALIALAACGLIYGRRFKRHWRNERRP